MRRLVVLGLLLGAPAGADVVPSDDAVAPRHVTASLHGVTARFDVRVRTTLDGESFPAATLEVGLPERGVVTGAAAIVGGRAHPLVLTPAEAANDAFWRLGSASGEYPAWGVLVTATSGAAQIDVAAPVAGAADIDLQIEAATCFARDARWVQVPESWRDVIETVGPPAGCGDAGRWIRFSAPIDKAVRIGTLAGRLPLPSSDFARVEIDLASELADVPPDLATAIVVDGSRSVTADEREEQRAIVASYLQHVPHTRVQLVAYSRRARALMPSWATTDSAAARIDRELRALDGRNGSNIDVGLAEAGAWLSRVDGTRRVIVFTDERIPMRIDSTTGEAWASLLPAGTLVHVVALRDDKPRANEPALVRDDGVTFAALAQTTGGIGVSGSLTDPIDATLLARPLSFDQVKVEGAGWATGIVDSCNQSDLPAGTSCTWWFGHGAPSAGPVAITGLLWNRRVERIVIPDPAYARTLARELSAIGGLDVPLQTEIDRAARAVNTVWSLYASWGGDGGYEDHVAFGEGRGTMIGVTSATIVDAIDTARGIPSVDLSAQLAGPLAACRSDGHATIAIELTRDEIVDVAVSNAGPQKQCLEDAVWNTLVALPDAVPRSRAFIAL